MPTFAQETQHLLRSTRDQTTGNPALERQALRAFLASGEDRTRERDTIIAQGFSPTQWVQWAWAARDFAALDRWTHPVSWTSPQAEGGSLLEAFLFEDQTDWLDFALNHGADINLPICNQTQTQETRLEGDPDEPGEYDVLKSRVRTPFLFEAAFLFFARKDTPRCRVRLMAHLADVAPHVLAQTFLQLNWPDMQTSRPVPKTFFQAMADQLDPMQVVHPLIFPVWGVRQAGFEIEPLPFLQAYVKTTHAFGMMAQRNHDQRSKKNAWDTLPAPPLSGRLSKVDRQTLAAQFPIGATRWAARHCRMTRLRPEFLDPLLHEWDNTLSAGPHGISVETSGSHLAYPGYPDVLALMLCRAENAMQGSTGMWLDDINPWGMAAMPDTVKPEDRIDWTTWVRFLGEAFELVAGRGENAYPDMVSHGIEAYLDPAFQAHWAETQPLLWALFRDETFSSRERYWTDEDRARFSMTLATLPAPGMRVAAPRKGVRL